MAARGHKSVLSTLKNIKFFTWSADSPNVPVSSRYQKPKYMGAEQKLCASLKTSGNLVIFVADLIQAFMVFVAFMATGASVFMARLHACMNL